MAQSVITVDSTIGEAAPCLASAVPVVSVPLADACCDLLELLGGVSDGRR
jgi:hypothetical protein